MTKAVQALLMQIRVVLAILALAAGCVASAEFVMNEPDKGQIVRKLLQIRGRPTNDPEEDIGDLRKRAEQGCAKAQYKLADRYWWGDRGVRRDDVKARSWFRCAAEQGHAESQHRLGTMCLDGQDDKEAYFWFSLAAKEGHSDAACLRDGVAKKLDENRRRHVEMRAESRFEEIRRKQKEKGEKR